VRPEREGVDRGKDLDDAREELVLVVLEKGRAEGGDLVEQAGELVFVVALDRSRRACDRVV